MNDHSDVSPTITQAFDDLEKNVLALKARHDALELAAGESIGAKLIMEERGRQITEEGWSADHDDGYPNAQLLDAATAYLDVAIDQLRGITLDQLENDGDGARSFLWPWDKDSFNPKPDVIRNLVRSAALIAAQIDSLKRKADGLAIYIAPNLGEVLSE